MWADMGDNGARKINQRDPSDQEIISRKHLSMSTGPNNNELLVFLMIILFHLAGQELDKISVWFRANRLFFNIKKSNFTFFKTCQKKINYAMVMEPLLIDRWCPY